MSAHPQRRRWLQISLRFVVLMVTVLCIGLAVDRRFREQRIVVETLTSIGARVTYHPRWKNGLPALPRHRHVKSINLSHERFKVEHLELLHKLPRLERLYLARTETTDEHLKIIGSLKQLRRLALWGTRITNSGVRHLESLEELRRLDVHENKLSEASMVSFAKLRKLRNLRVSYRSWSDLGLHQLGKIPQVHVGPLRLVAVSDEGLRSLGRLKQANYQIQVMARCQITDEGLLGLVDGQGMLPVGPSFQLQNCPITDRVLPHLPWAKLGDVRFIGTRITFEGVVPFVGPDVKALYVGKNSCGLADGWDWSKSTAWSPAGRSVLVDVSPSSLSDEQLSALPNLTDLILQSPDDIGNLVQHLEHHQHLTHASMDYCPRPNQIIQQLARLRHLQHLKFNFCNLDPRQASIVPLAALQELKTLRISCTPFGDDQFATLGRMKRLESIELMSADQVKGPGLRHLVPLPELRVLKLQSRANWDAAIDHLLKLAQVRRLTLIDVQLSDENLNRFQAVKGRQYFDW